MLKSAVSFKFILVSSRESGIDQQVGDCIGGPTLKTNTQNTCQGADEGWIHRWCLFFSCLRLVGLEVRVTCKI